MQYALCPYCLSSLQITATQLTLKDGLIRCGHCNETFNALENPCSQQQALTLPTNKDETTADTEHTAPWETQNKVIAHKKKAYPLIALFLSLLLLAQLTYINASLIQQNIRLQPSLTWLNNTFNLQIPLYRDLNKIIIIERQLSNQPNTNQALSLQLSFKNTAPIEQAYPSVLLTLNSDYGDKLAYIVFKPSEYLSPQKTQQLFKSGEIQSIELSFKKPLVDASGFEIAFHH